jgi:hypothetical protein
MSWLRAVYSLVLVFSLSAVVTANDQSDVQHGSATVELLPLSGTVHIEPRIPVRRSLLPLIGFNDQIVVANPQDSMINMLSREARVESEGDTPTYWRVLAPVLITVAVGATTLLLFTIRSG